MLHEKDSEGEDHKQEEVAISLPPPPTAVSPLTVCLLCAGNISVSVLLVLSNKIAMTTYHFKFILALTTLHFITTACATRVCALIGLFVPKRTLPYSDIALLGGAGTVSIALMNANLQTNSVGFYQMSKLCLIPFTVILQVTLYAVGFTRKVYAALFIVLTGVGMATISDVQFNGLGCVYAVLAVLSTAQFQIWQGTKQKQYQLNPMQITDTMMPYMACLMIMAVGVIEVRMGVFDFKWTNGAMLAVGVSCLMAIGVNILTYAIIGKTSPVTYQLVGHVKTCLTLTGGFLLFPASIPPSDKLLIAVGGIVIALVGTVLYSNTQMKASRDPKEHDFFDKYLPKPILAFLNPATATSQQL